MVFCKWFDILFCIFGFVVMVYIISLMVMSWVLGFEGGGVLGYCDLKGYVFWMII